MDDPLPPHPAASAAKTNVAMTAAPVRAVDNSVRRGRSSTRVFSFKSSRALADAARREYESELVAQYALTDRDPSSEGRVVRVQIAVRPALQVEARMAAAPGDRIGKVAYALRAHASRETLIPALQVRVLRWAHATLPAC